MIKINLLPKKSQKTLLRPDLYLLLFLCLLNALVMLGIYWSNANSISNRRAAIEKARREIASLDKTHKEYLFMEKEKKEIVRRLKVMDSLKEGRALAARTLHDLSAVMKERVWIKTFKKTEDAFEIEGRSLENDSISDFMETISSVPYFKNVELKRVEDVSEDGLMLKKFFLQGTIAL